MVSVIVPVYKAEKYLKYCIGSLQNQTFQDMEMILVDDGSSDQSGEICDVYAAQDSRIRVIHKENGGVSSARNAGIEAAGGEYIVFADSDDYAEPDYIKTLVSAREADPDAGHIWCCFQTVSGYAHEDAKPNWFSDDPEMQFERSEIMTLHEIWLDAGPYCKLYRKDIIRENHLRFDETLSLGEDWLFNLAYLDAIPDTSIKVIAKPLYNYVQINPESLDHIYRPDMLEIYQKINTACERYLKKWKVSSEQMQKFCNSWYYSLDKVMRNNMKNPEITCGACIRQNNRLIKSETFQSVYEKTDCYLNPLYRAAYKAGNFRLVLLADRLAAIKRKAL